jgi:hypothetical protein
MSNEVDVQRAIGRLEGTVSAQGRQLSSIDAKVGKLVEYMERSKGGVRTLAAVGASAASASAVAVELFHKFVGHP